MMPDDAHLPAPRRNSEGAILADVRDAEAPPCGSATGQDFTRDAFLGNLLWLRQPRRGYRAGLDAVLLAASVGAAGEDGTGRMQVADCGAGAGTVGLCIARRLPTAEVTLIEREPLYASLARINAQDNDLADRVRVVEADLTAPFEAIAGRGLNSGSYDVVVANPPFHDVGSGTLSGEPLKDGANAMPSGDLETWCRRMAHLSRPGGIALMVHKADRLAEILAGMENRFGGLTVLPVHPREGAAAHRIIVRGVKGSRAPLTLASGFVVHDSGNAFSPAAEAILRHGAPLSF